MIDIVRIEEEYVKYLRRFDNNVMNNKDEKRVYIGVILSIKGNLYFAPMSSPKNKHKKMKASQKDIYKIKNGELGIININNMIPVKPSEIKRIEIKRQKDKPYKILLNKQVLDIRENSEKIQKKAKKLYRIINDEKASQSKNSNLSKRCCDFKLLEKKMQMYEKQKLAPETEEEPEMTM